MSCVILARGPVQTRRTVTQIDSILTVGAGVARQAHARIRIYPVDAGASMNATVLGTVFVVGLTVNAREAQRTGAGVRIDILVARSSIVTRI